MSRAHLCGSACSLHCGRAAHVGDFLASSATLVRQ
jgi:hypothetical protein